MQVSQSAAASIELAKKLVEGFSSGGTKVAQDQALNNFAALADSDKAAVRDALKKLVSDDDTIYERISEAAKKANIAFLDSRSVAAGQGADTAKAGAEGTAKVVETRVKAAATPAAAAPVTPPEDPFAAVETMLKNTELDSAKLEKLMTEMSPADRKAMEQALAGLAQAGTKALSDAGRYQMAMAKALRDFSKLPPEEAAAKKQKLFTEMQAFVAKTVVDGLDLSPAGLEKIGFPKDTDPALVKAALQGDKQAIDKLNAMLGGPDAVSGPDLSPAGLERMGLPKDTDPALVKAAMAGDKGAMKVLSAMTKRPDALQMLEKERESKRVERELRNDLSRTQSILSIVNSGGSIDDILVAVMLLMMQDNDLQLRQRTADMERKRAANNDLSRKRKIKDTAEMRGKELELKKMQEELATLKASPPASPPPPAAPPSPASEPVTEVASPAPEAAPTPAPAPTPTPVAEKKKEPEQLSLPGVVDKKKEAEQLTLPGVSMEATAAASATTVTVTVTAGDAAKTAKAATASAGGTVAGAAASVTTGGATTVTAAASATGAVASTKAEVAVSVTSTTQQEWADKVADLEKRIRPLAKTVDAHTSELTDLDDQIADGQSSVDKINFQIQQLVDRRKMIFELISKILSVFSQLASVANQNIRG